MHVIQEVPALKRAYTELGSACLFSLQYLISLIKYKSQTKIVQTLFKTECTLTKLKQTCIIVKKTH